MTPRHRVCQSRLPKGILWLKQPKLVDEHRRFFIHKVCSTWCSCLCFTGSQLNFLGAKWWLTFDPFLTTSTNWGFPIVFLRKERNHIFGTAIASFGLFLVTNWKPATAALKQAPSQEHTPFGRYILRPGYPKNRRLGWFHLLMTYVASCWQICHYFVGVNLQPNKHQGGGTWHNYFESSMTSQTRFIS